MRSISSRGLAPASATSWLPVWRRSCSGPRPLAFDATHRLDGCAADHLGVAVGGVVTLLGKLSTTNPQPRRGRMARFILVKISFMAEITDADALREAALKNPASPT